MTKARLFDTRNSQTDIRKYLDLPPKGWDVIVDKKWAKMMDQVTDAYSRADFNTQTSWRFVASSDKDAVTWSMLSAWRVGGCEWEIAKLEQVVLWRLQILHKRERDQWWQERKRRGSKQEPVPYAASDTSESSSTSEASSFADSPTASRRVSVVAATMYDPVREAASWNARS